MDRDRLRRPSPPILDMTPEGGFREPASVPRTGWLDRFLAQVGGAALLLALAAGGLVVVALAFVLLGLLIPVAICAGLVAFVAVSWRLRRLRARGGTPLVILRRQGR
ncbi:MAG: hypothetical protein ICV73_30860 [Acetobacteraceae bacterium]|nr:hypothetical protein [Acetobacteraceae bacterium]